MAEPQIPPAGFICSDKPAGVTSHDVVARYRRELGARTGHAGTLDPFATGLLIVLLGPATRLQRYVLGLPKTYVATARLGWRSTTGDPDGELTETGRIPEHPELPTGRITQTVPMTSAVRVGGERLYRKAHRGETVERPTREVEIHRAELIGAGEGTATFEIECSSGTYVRTLIETLDDAYCSELRRTAIGELTLPEVAAGETIRPPAELVGHLHGVEIDDDQERRVRNGIRIPAPAGLGGAGDEPIRLTREGELVAIARAQGGALRTEVVLPVIE
ncbi:MAG TPA: tRNA pseudouridine(55) synthase TruB [Solirubrobacterales bacterium]|nr:tRNA pseudouridine(55) synthase TruB [Solirubrobacterales bacterium]